MKKLYKKYKALTDKFKDIDSRTVKVTLIVTMLFISVWIIYGIHINDFSRLYRAITDDLIMCQTERESGSLSTSVSQRCDIVRYLGVSVGRVRDEDFTQNISGVLNNAMQSGSFEYVVYIDNKGNTFFSGGSSTNELPVGEIIEKCDISKSYTLFHNGSNFLTDSGTFGIIAPVKYNETVKGYVLGLSEYSGLVDDSKIRREMDHDEIIIDEEGNVLAKVNNDETVKVFDEKISFFDQAHQVMTIVDFDQFVSEYDECMAAGIPGRSNIKTVNGKEVFIYYPIEAAGGWSVMNCYKESQIEARMSRIQTTAIVMFAIIVCIMIWAAIILIRYLSGEKKRLSSLEYLDGLTGVFNRSAFVSRTEEVLAENKNLPYYMICFDVVNFRIINETYGHERSDNIIIEMARACQEAFGHNEVYGRLTADVFVALTIDDGEEIERINYIEQRVADEAKKFFINHPIKIKRGRYEVMDINESINSMIDKANIARKFVNINANPLACKYTDDLMNDARKAEDIESRMEDALANGEFKPYLQAKYNMVENHVSGAEALVRWIKPDGSIVPPGDFIPLFEKNGFVEKVDFYMLEEICKYLRRMIDEGREVYKVSVNQSRYLMNDPEYVSKVKSILLKYQIPVGLIELELTETVFFHEKERMVQMIKDLKLMNVDLSIDDFGSGYSSFNILKDVPFDVLKIDREFLSDSVHTEKGTWILREIIDMAHGLGMSVICEGVETKEQIDLLISLDCHYAQGFYYARPIPLEEFIEKYNLKKQ